MFSLFKRLNIRNSRRLYSSLYNFSEDERMMKDAAENFAQEVVKPLVREMDNKMKLDSKLIEKLFSGGLMGIEIPTKFSGTGSTFFSAILVIEELARIDPSVAILVDIHNTCVNTLLLKYASEKLQNKWLPRLAADTIGSFCLSEASSGSDAFQLKSTAIPDKEGNYILNGSKLWISSSVEAGLFLVFANVDPSKKYKGITCFAVDPKAEGVSIGKPESKLCLRASSTCPLTFQNVKLTKDDVVGEVGKGYKYAIEILNEGRIGIGAQMIGLARGTLDISVPYTRQRVQFGKPISEFQSMQHQLAEVATQLEAARLLVYNAARLKDENQNFVKEASMAKYYSSEVASFTARKSVEWMGGMGITTDFLVEKFYRDNIIGAIYEGTSNIQLNTIAKYFDK